MTLEIVQLFGVATWVRTGQPARRRFGVPPGGPFDVESYRLACALVGVAEGAPALELGMAHAVVRAKEDGPIAIVGSAPRIVSLKRGETLEIAPSTAGARTYLAQGRAPVLERRLARLPSSLVRRPLRVVSGPQAASFDLDRIVSSPFRVSWTLDRVGVRLEGEGPIHRLELPSEPACPGAVQVTPNGTLIVLGPDGPTIGGYPKPLVVATVDSDRVGQLRPGDDVRFSLVSLDEARALREENERRISAACAEIRLSAMR